MSDMERIKITLKPIEMTEDEARNICVERGYEFYNTWIQTLCSESDDYVFIKNIGVNKVENKEKLNPNYFAEMIRNKDGTISFHMLFYNGGAHWTEIIEELVDPT